MKLNRVVVTGYGLTSPIGNTPEEFWNSLKEGRIGIGPITKFDHSDFAVHNAAEIQDFPFDKYFIKKDTNRFDNYSLYALYAAQEAVNHAGLDVEAIDKDRFGVIVASGIGGIKEIEDQVIRLHEKGPKRVKPMTLPKALPNMASGNVAMRFGANGICKSINTACASSNDAIGDAFRAIKFGFQDLMLVGGSEASITPFAIAGFQALTALSTTEDPTRASIPFDKDRNGFVMGEGSGMLVLESLEHAEKRGATILAEVVGYGNTCDAYHMTSPHPEGQGAIKAMKLALDEAEIEPAQVDYVNAHGTSTPKKEKVVQSFLYLVQKFQYLLQNHLQVTSWEQQGQLKLLRRLKQFAINMFQKLLEHKSYQIILKPMSSLVKGKNVRFPLLFPIHLDLEDTMLS